MQIKLLFTLSLFFLVVDVASQDLPPQLTAEQVKNINAATPSLPQTPVVKRATTDAQDGGLKGKVSRVISEDEDLTDSWETKGRHFNSIAYYNGGGNLTKRISFYLGRPSDVTVYGYVNGMRVSDFNDVAGSQVNTGAMSPEDKALFTPTREADPRFTYEYRFTYDKGRLVGKDYYMNDGSLWLRYVFSRTATEFEELVYSNDGKLNQKYISKLDKRGNEVEQLDVAVINTQWRGDRKYKIKYESFDKNGNWTKRVKFKVESDNGKEVLKPWYATYRTISYHAK